MGLDLNGVFVSTTGNQSTATYTGTAKGADRSGATAVTTPVADTAPAEKADLLTGGTIAKSSASVANVVLPKGEEPAATASPDAHAKLSSFVSFQTANNGEEANKTMNDVAKYTATRDQPVDRPVTQSSSGSRVAKSSDLPAGLLTANSDGSITTPGGYKVVNDGGYQWRVIEPDGKEHRIWGDPHVDENNDGTNDWHFNEDASFVLPDGSKIFCDTNKVSEYGGQDVTVSTNLTIQYRDQMATMDTAKGGAAKLSTGGGLSYDAMHADGALFVLSDSHTFVDGKTLGDLYDAGGDFKADINASQQGTISANASIAVAASLGLALPGSTTVTTREQKSPSGGGLSDLVASVYDGTGTVADLSGEGAGQSKPKSSGKETNKPKTVVTGGGLASLNTAALSAGSGSNDAASVGPSRGA